MKKKPVKKKKAPVALPKSPYPEAWLYISPKEMTVQQLRDYFRTIPELDVECWPELGVLELTFPNKRYIDFERSEPALGEKAGDQFLADHRAKSLYMVSAEPICTQDEVDFLRQSAKALGGLFAADTEDFQPVLEGGGKLP